MLAIIAWIFGAYLFGALAVFAYLARTPMDSAEAAVTALCWPYIAMGLLWELARDAWIRWFD